MDSVTVALWATNLAMPVNGIDGWAALVDGQMGEAKAAGAALLVMPEYASVQWLCFAPQHLRIDEEVAWMAAQGEAALEAVAPLAAKHDMALLAGTMPWRQDGDGANSGAAQYVNRAWLILPEGRRIAYDKLVLTPGEMDPAAWMLAPGDAVRIVEWRGLRMTTMICLDVEMPALAARLASLDLDLVLVPSMTGQRSGYHRVFDCAKARAVELQTLVCAVGAIGVPEHFKKRDTNFSGAAGFMPCEALLGHDGIADSIGPWGEVEGPGPMLILRDLPIETVRRLRHGLAEVWPGAWSAEHVRIEELGSQAR